MFHLIQRKTRRNQTAYHSVCCPKLSGRRKSVSSLETPQAQQPEHSRLLRQALCREAEPPYGRLPGCPLGVCRALSAREQKHPVDSTAAYQARRFQAPRPRRQAPTNACECACFRRRYRHRRNRAPVRTLKSLAFSIRAVKGMDGAAHGLKPRFARRTVDSSQQSERL